MAKEKQPPAPIEPMSCIILGDNHFWYSSFMASKKEDIDAELRRVQRGIEAKEYESTGICKNLLIYQVGHLKTINIEK